MHTLAHVCIAALLFLPLRLLVSYSSSLIHWVSFKLISDKSFCSSYNSCTLSSVVWSIPSVQSSLKNIYDFIQVLVLLPPHLIPVVSTLHGDDNFGTVFRVVYIIMVRSYTIFLTRRIHGFLKSFVHGSPRGHELLML